MVRSDQLLCQLLRRPHAFPDPDADSARVLAALALSAAFPVEGRWLTGTTGRSPLRARVAVIGATIRVWDVHTGTSDFCPDHALALREEFTTLLENATRIEWRVTILILHAGPGRPEFTPSAKP